jgi:hypothetical protein
MKWWKLSLLGVSTYVVSHFAALLAGPSADQFAHDLAVSFLSILGGLLIGAVGVFLGSLGNLLAALHARDEISTQNLRTLSDGIANTVREVKHDVLFSLLAVAGVFALELWKIVDLPGLHWPFSSSLLTKHVVANALSYTLILLSFVAVIDCVRVMFTLHAQYDTLLRADLDQRRGTDSHASQPPRLGA